MTGAPTALLASGLAAGIATLPSGAGALYVRDDVPVALCDALAEQPRHAAASISAAPRP